MQLSPNSKKLIIAIAAMTALGVLLTTPPAPEPPSGSIANTSGQSIGQDLVLDPTTIKSLTNLTQNIQFNESDSILEYRGYIQGVGYSSYQILAEKGQIVHIQLDAPPTLEMLLYGINIVPLNNEVEYTFPENGLYDLRVLYKPAIEAEQAKAVTAPEPYRISFTLKHQTTSPSSQ